jgi:hypothetical protein
LLGLGTFPPKTSNPTEPNQKFGLFSFQFLYFKSSVLGFSFGFLLKPNRRIIAKRGGSSPSRPAHRPNAPCPRVPNHTSIARALPDSVTPTPTHTLTLNRISASGGDTGITARDWTAHDKQLGGRHCGTSKSARRRRAARQNPGAALAAAFASSEARMASDARREATNDYPHHKFSNQDNGDTDRVVLQCKFCFGLEVFGLLLFSDLVVNHRTRTTS